MNPAAPHCLATASNDRTVRVFDVRMLRTVPELSEAPVKLASDEMEALDALYSQVQLDAAHKKMACTSIDFSPDGRHLAGLCYDDTLSIWDMEPAWLSRQASSVSTNTRRAKTGKLTDWIKPEDTAAVPPRPASLLAHPHVQTHNNQTGKWVTLFRASWHRNDQLEPHFSLGSMTRHAEIYGKDGRLMASLYDPDWVTAVPAVTAMHPLLPAKMATGNGSGRCMLWTARTP